MSMEIELQRYLALGMDLQHRRLERVRTLTTGEPYQKQFEERVKWRQEVPYKVRPSAPMLPATWEILPNTSWND